MIATLLSTVLSVLFTSLGLIHIYWLLGGKWGGDKVIPTKANQMDTASIQIPKFATLLVASVLVLFGLIYLIKAGYTPFHVPSWVANYGYWIIPSIFILRALGDFKYIGFFKTVRNTNFAKADTRLFSPLCLGIGLIGVVIQLLAMIR